MVELLNQKTALARPLLNGLGGSRQGLGDHRKFGKGRGHGFNRLAATQCAGARRKPGAGDRKGPAERISEHNRKAEGRRSREEEGEQRTRQRRRYHVLRNAGAKQPTRYVRIVIPSQNRDPFHIPRGKRSRRSDGPGEILRTPGLPRVLLVPLRAGHKLPRSIADPDNPARRNRRKKRIADARRRHSDGEDKILPLRPDRKRDGDAKFPRERAWVNVRYKQAALCECGTLGAGERNRVGQLSAKSHLGIEDLALTQLA